MSVLPHVFVFVFAYDDDSEEEYIIELLSGPGVVNSVEILPEIPEETTELIYDEINSRGLEIEFGVHDWSTGDHPNRVELIGFDTYEVDKAHVQNLLNVWKEILTKAGYQLGKQLKVK